MGTDTLAFANFILIIQVVSTATSAAPDGLQLQRWDDVSNTRKEAANEKYLLMRGNKSTSERGLTMTPSFMNLDDANELQIPPPPTHKGALAESTFEDVKTGHAIGGTSEDHASVDSRKLSGAGHLGTNEILKNPDVLPITSVPSSDDNSYNKQYKTNEEQASAKKRFRNYPNLDEAVENAVNNLPSSDESPLVPLIRALNRRVHEKSTDENENSKDSAKSKFTKQYLILKLAKNVQQQKMYNDIQTRGLNTQAPVNHQQEEQLPEAKTQNEGGEDQPCDCEGTCDEADNNQTNQENGRDGEQSTQDQAESGDSETNKQESTPEQTGCGEETAQDQTETENVQERDSQAGDDIQTNNTHPKLLARVIIMLKKPNTEETNTEQNIPPMSFSPFGIDQQSQPQQYPSLAEMFARVLIRSTMITAIPPMPFNTNMDNSRSEQLPTDEATTGCGGDDNEGSLQENNRSFAPGPFGDDNGNESGEFMQRPSSFVPDVQNSIIQNQIGYRQTLPKDLILLKSLGRIIRQRANANALKESNEKELLPFPSFEESSQNLSPPIPRLVIIKPRKDLLEPQLSPLHFPSETTHIKIRLLGNSESPILRQLQQNGSENEKEPEFRVKTLNTGYADNTNDLFSQQNSLPQDVPFFIKNILANFGRQGGTQPIPTPSSPLQEPTKENTHVLFRVLLAPHSL